MRSLICLQQRAIAITTELRWAILFAQGGFDGGLDLG
jgi:hypothetical protein